MEKVTLRKIEDKDTNLIVCWRNKAHVRNNFIYQEDLTKEIHEGWIKNFLEKEKAVQFIIEYDSIPIGTTYLRDIDRQHRKAEFGIYIGEHKYMGKGIGAAAMEKILAYGFSNLNLHKIFLRVLSTNIMAIRSYEKNGFIKEGVLKDEYYLNGAFCDVVFMARFE